MHEREATRELIPLTSIMQEALRRYWHCLNCDWGEGPDSLPIAYGEGERVYMEARCAYCGKVTRLEM